MNITIIDNYDIIIPIVTIPIVDFFLCNENYHIEHHLYPTVPWYNLKKVHKIIKNNLNNNNSTIIFSFREFILQFFNKTVNTIKA